MRPGLTMARSLVVRRLVSHPARSLLSALAVAAGVTLAVAITIVVDSVDRSLEAFGARIAGPAELRIAGATARGGLPLDSVAAAEQVSGVAAVVPMIQAVVPVQGPDRGYDPVLVLGLDCRAEALFGPFGCDPDHLAGAQGPLVIGPAVEPAGRLRTDRGRVALDQAPVMDDLRAVSAGAVVVMGLPAAQHHLTRPDQVDVAYVLVDQGADPEEVRADLAATLGAHLPVLEATAAPAGARAVLGAVLPIYSLLGIFALGVGAVLVANTASMTVESRRRELAVLGALGGRRRLIGGSTVAEMSILGAAGGFLGSLGGAVVAQPIVASLSGFTESVAGVTLSTTLGASAMATGVLLGVALAGGASLPAARRATRLDVAAELSGRAAGEAARAPRLGIRLALWSLPVAVGALLCWAAQRDGGLDPWQAAVVTPGFLLVTVGLLLAAAAGAPILAGWARLLVRASSSAPLQLALVAGRRDHRRTGVLVVAVGAAVVTAFVTEGTSAAARRSIEASFARSGAGVYVSTLPDDAANLSGVTPEQLVALHQVPGVAGVRVGTFLAVGGGQDRVLVQAVDDNPLVPQVIDGVADAARLEAGEVLVGAGLARRQGIRAGDEVQLATPGGPVALPVQGIWEEGNNQGSNVTMAPSMLHELYGPQAPTFVSVRPADGYDEAELAAAIDATGIDPDLRTRASAEVARDIADQVDGEFASFRVMQRALVAVLLVAVASSLMLAAVQRRRELGLLGAVGAEPGTLGRVLLVEGAMVSALGVAVSVLIGPVMMWAMHNVLPFVIGFRNPLTFHWASLFLAGLICLPVVLAGAALPARRAARTEVLDALRWE